MQQSAVEQGAEIFDLFIPSSGCVVDTVGIIRSACKCVSLVIGCSSTLQAPSFCSSGATNEQGKLHGKLVFPMHHAACDGSHEDTLPDIG